jgi:phage shock protein PspC (stress-responsive transcriptional regulator)
VAKSKQLFRSKKDRILAGICAGIGEYLDIDSTVIRVLLVLFTIMTGLFPGLIFYFMLWVIIPEEK